ncbi:MAG: MoaD/ThiS family protein [Acidobacteriota bacterium]
MELHLTVLFFAAAADASGLRSRPVRLQKGATVADVLSFVRAEYPALGSQRLLTAVNEEYAPSDRLLVEGDEIALFTAVSGG